MQFEIKTDKTELVGNPPWRIPIEINLKWIKRLKGRKIDVEISVNKSTKSITC